MDPRVVFLKTPKGETEISTREYKLNHALRYVLILVNGKSTVGEILSKGAGLPNIRDALSQLAAQQFIHTIADAANQNSQDPYQDPKNEIIDMVKKLLGTHAAPVIRKFHESAGTTEALVETTNACKRLIKIAIDDQKAEDFARHAQEIIFSSTRQQQH